MPRSMTGYARTRKQIGSGDLTVTLKSVNHRGLDLHFHLPLELDPFEPALRALLKRRLVRGHVDLRISFVRTAGEAPPAINRALLDAYLSAFRQAAAEHGLRGEPDLNAALRLPGMLSESAGAEPDSGMEAAVLAALEEALDLLDQFRKREGEELAGQLRRHNQAIREAAAGMEGLRATAVPALQARLTERIRELLGGANLDPQRLAQEAALLVDRGDIGEEMTRLKIHSEHLDEILALPGEAGKKLDFLLQEMNRETNTILSKTNGIGDIGLKITELALAAKADIEKIREQALNLE